MKRSVALTIGSAVLAAVALVCWRIVEAASAAVAPIVPVETPAPAAALPPSSIGAAVAASTAAVAPTGSNADTKITGVVLRPGGAPAANAEVRLFLLSTGWPAWQRKPITQIYRTQSDGSFEFKNTARGPNLLVEFKHSDFTGDLVEASPLVTHLQLRLQHGFEVSGYVHAAGEPSLDLCEVMLEPGPSDTRRTVDVKCDSFGRFHFARVAAGTVRVVARHPRWQPVSASYAVGPAEPLDLRLEKPTLKLTGLVSAAGTQQMPLVGAEVLAYPNMPNFGLFKPILAVTDVNGRFGLSGIGRGNLHIEVRHPEFTTASRKLAISSASAEIPPFELVPRSDVHGLLHMPPGALAGGQRLPTLLLHSDDGGDNSSCQVTADGRFHFPAFSAGRATLEVLAGQLAFRNAAASTSVRINDAPRTELDLEAVAPAELKGKVVDVGGQPLAGVQVFLTQREQITNALREAGTALLEIDLGKFRDQVTRKSVAEPERLIAVSADDGSFRITGLPAGTVTLHALRSGYAGRLFDANVPAAGATERMLDWELRRGCRIEGRVLRANRPQTGAVVSAIGDAGSAMAVVDDKGRFVLEDLPAGDYRLRARFASLPTVDQVVKASEQAIATVELPFAAFGRQVKGMVVDQDDQPIANAYVAVVGGRGVLEQTDAAGQFTVEVLKGRIQLRAFLGDRQVQQTVVVDDTTKPVKIVLDPPPTATLRARVLALPERHRPASVILMTTSLDDTAAVPQVRRIDLTDEGLVDQSFPAGRAKVAIGGEGYAPWSQEVVLQPGENKNLGEVMLEPACTLYGCVVDDKGGQPVAGCMVFLGDEGDESLLRPTLRSDADGTFKLGGVCMAARNLVAKAPGFAPKMLTLKLPSDLLGSDALHPLPVRLDRGSTIEVTVRKGLSGDEGFVLLFRKRTGDSAGTNARSRQIATADLDVDGHAKFPNCAVGDYEVGLLGDEKVRQEVHVPDPGLKIPVTLQ